MFLFVILTIALFYCYIRNVHEKNQPPPSTEVAPEKEKVKAEDSLILTYQELCSPPFPASVIEETNV